MHTEYESTRWLSVLEHKIGERVIPSHRNDQIYSSACAGLWEEPTIYMWWQNCMNIYNYIPQYSQDIYTTLLALLINLHCCYN